MGCPSAQTVRNWVAQAARDTGHRTDDLTTPERAELRLRHAYDNAMAESFFATQECERLDRRRFRTQADARVALFRNIEGRYHPHGRHSALGTRSALADGLRTARVSYGLIPKSLPVHGTG